MGTQNSKIAKVINDSVSYYKKPLLLPTIDRETLSFLEGGMQPIKKYKQKTTEMICFSAQPVSHNVHHNLEANLSGNLSQRRVEKTSEWPWCAHGIILTKIKGTIYWSSGTLITANIVLTAAQNLYSHEHGAYAEIIGYFPAVDGNNIPFGEVKVEDYFIPQEYIDSSAENYALLMLQNPIGEITGHLGLHVINANFALTQTFTVTGYPSDKVKGEPLMYEMWHIEGNPSSAAEDVVSYQVVSSPGSAVYAARDRPFIVGVHIQGNKGDSGITLITRSRYDRMYKWIKDTVERKVSLSQTDYAREIDLYKSGIHSSGLRSFVTYSLKNLIRLSAVNCNLEETEARILATNTTWTNLEELILSQNHIGVIGAEYLANNTSWIKLKKLDLVANKLRSVEAQALVKNTSWINLEKLLLGDNQLGDSGVEALIKNQSWINLKELGLNYNQLGDVAIEHLAQSNKWPNLRKIDIGNNNIGPSGIEILAKSNSWPNLRKLGLWFNKLGDIGVGALAANSTWVNLKYLDLNNTEIGSAGAELLSRNTSWINLEKLYLGNNNIGNIGIGELAKNTSWVNLQWLDLCSVRITSIGARALAQNHSWNKLSMLILDHNEIEADGKEALQGNVHWPKAHIAYDYYAD